jgi:hypothetical protein
MSPHNIFIAEQPIGVDCGRAGAVLENREFAPPASRDKRKRGDWAMRPGFGAKRVAVAACQFTSKNSATTASHEFFVAARNFRAKTACALPGRRAGVATDATLIKNQAENLVWHRVGIFRPLRDGSSMIGGK